MAEGTRKVYESLRRNIHGDLTDRSTWATKQNEIVRRRLSARRKQKTKPYKGAPNFVEPIIDDNVREKTDQEISMLLNAPVMAHAIPLSGEISAEDRYISPPYRRDQADPGRRDRHEERAGIHYFLASAICE